MLLTKEQRQDLVVSSSRSTPHLRRTFSIKDVSNINSRIHQALVKLHGENPNAFLTVAYKDEDGTMKFKDNASLLKARKFYHQPKTLKYDEYYSYELPLKREYF
jgi:hypothetical protein